MSFDPIFFLVNSTETDSCLSNIYSFPGHTNLPSVDSEGSGTVNNFNPSTYYSSGSVLVGASSVDVTGLSEFKEVPPISIEIGLGSTTENIGKFFVRFDAFLAGMVNDYVAGSKDIPDLVQELGGNWTDSSVVLLLERFNAHRPLMLSPISEDDEMAILRRLANIRASNLINNYDDEEWIRREVIASQRIEFVYVSPEEFTEQ